MERSEFEKNVSESRNNYNISYAEKEKLAKKVSEISKEIGSIIEDVKKAKTERNKSNDEIKKIKETRNKLNDEVKVLVEKAKTYGNVQNVKRGPSPSSIREKLKN